MLRGLDSSPPEVAVVSVCVWAATVSVVNVWLWVLAVSSALVWLIAPSLKPLDNRAESVPPVAGPPLVSAV